MSNQSNYVKASILESRSVDLSLLKLEHRAEDRLAKKSTYKTTTTSLTDFSNSSTRCSNRNCGCIFVDRNRDNICLCEKICPSCEFENEISSALDACKKFITDKAEFTQLFDQFLTQFDESNPPRECFKCGKEKWAKASLEKVIDSHSYYAKRIQNQALMIKNQALTIAEHEKSIKNKDEEIQRLRQEFARCRSRPESGLNSMIQQHSLKFQGASRQHSDERAIIDGDSIKITESQIEASGNEAISNDFEDSVKTQADLVQRLLEKNVIMGESKFDESELNNFVGSIQNSVAVNGRKNDYESLIDNDMPNAADPLVDNNIRLNDQGLQEPSSNRDSKNNSQIDNPSEKSNKDYSKRNQSTKTAKYRTSNKNGNSKNELLLRAQEMLSKTDKTKGIFNSIQDQAGSNNSSRMIDEKSLGSGIENLDLNNFRIDSDSIPYHQEKEETKDLQMDLSRNPPQDPKRKDSDINNLKAYGDSIVASKNELNSGLDFIPEYGIFDGMKSNAASIMFSEKNFNNYAIKDIPFGGVSNDEPNPINIPGISCAESITIRDPEAINALQKGIGLSDNHVIPKGSGNDGIPKELDNLVIPKETNAPAPKKIRLLSNDQKTS